MLLNHRAWGVNHRTVTASCAIWFGCVVCAGFTIESALAQAPPITPSGLNTQVSNPITLPSNQVQYTITGGTRPGGGPNLFHSFGDFNVPSNNIANFLNNTGLATSNILGRVTAGNPSTILGTIQTTGFGNANLFLMNPAGIIFGPNATLNVGGSVSFTTANYIRLFDGVNSANFYANPASDLLPNSILTLPPLTSFGFLSASPAAYGFLDGNAASITIQGGTLEVPSGRTLSFIGGPTPLSSPPGENPLPSGVTMTGGSLSAPNGLIYMATVTSPGEAPIPTLSGAPLGNPGTPASSNALIRIRSGEFVMDNAFLTASNTGDVAALPIDIHVQGAMTMRNASSISTDTSGMGRGSDIQIAAQSLQLDGSFITTSTSGGGPGGGIVIDGHTQTINLANGSMIMSTTTGDGDGGAIVLGATDTISLGGFDVNGNPSGILTSASAGGRGGDVTVASSDITLETAFIASLAAGAGAGGTISIHGPTSGSGTFNLNAGSQVVSSAEGSGAAGSIVLDLAEATVRDGSAVFSQNQGSAEAGVIRVTASNGLTVTGADAADNPSMIFSDAGFNFTQGQPVPGKGATIDIQAHSVTIENLGTIKTTTSGPAHAGDITLHDIQNFTLRSGGSIESATLSTGSSGAITLDATTLSIAGLYDANSLTRITNRSTSLNGGPNGGINIHAGTFELQDQARIISETSNNAANGNVTINADQSVSVRNGSRISILADLQDVASLQITAPTITIDGHGTGLSTRSVGPGKAGDISLTATQGNLILSGGSEVVSSTEQGSGPGGAIVAHAANSIELSGGANITTSSFRTGPAGSITATADNVVSLSGPGTGLFSEAFGSARGGNIVVTGSQVQLSNGATISAKAEPLQGTAGTGNAGNISIAAGGDFQNNGGIVRTTAAHGLGGDILITAGQDILLNGNAAISASSTGPGNAGNITALAGDDFVMQNSSMTTQATQASGGNIKIGAQDQVLLQNSLVSASVMGGGGSGGNISIDPIYVILQNSQIIAQATQGQGGNISITTNLFLPDSVSIVSASSEFGVNGTVNIQSPLSQLGGKLSPLPKNSLESTTWINSRCRALAGGQASSFVVAGREMLPAEPGGWLGSPVTGLTGEPVFSAHVPSFPQIHMTPSLEDTVSLRRMTPPGFLLQAFATDRLADCTS